MGGWHEAFSDDDTEAEGTLTACGGEVCDERSSGGAEMGHVTVLSKDMVTPYR